MKLFLWSVVMLFLSGLAGMSAAEPQKIHITFASQPE